MNVFPRPILSHFTGQSAIHDTCFRQTAIICGGLKARNWLKSEKYIIYLTVLGFICTLLLVCFLQRMKVIWFRLNKKSAYIIKNAPTFTCFSWNFIRPRPRFIQLKRTNHNGTPITNDYEVFHSFDVQLSKNYLLV